MAIRTVVTRGFGNGTFNGTIALVAVRGYLGVVATPYLGACVAASQSFAAGERAAGAFAAGSRANQSFAAGDPAAQGNCGV